VGKLSFEDNKIYENASRVIDALNEIKPASIKGRFVKSLFISSSMNPGLRLTA
jgi:large subunit ribosomal protein L1